MNPIPPKIKKPLNQDPFMIVCIHARFKHDIINCILTERPQWEHPWEHAGCQINELWSIVPCCRYHNRAPMSRDDKDFNQYISLLRAFQFGWTFEMLQKEYPRYDTSWVFEFGRLDKDFGCLEEVRIYKQVIGL